MADTATQQAFLAKAQVGILSTVGPKGGPHAVPIWYLYEEGQIRISISRGSQKHKNVERDGRVALTRSSGGASLLLADGAGPSVDRAGLHGGGAAATGDPLSG